MKWALVNFILLATYHFKADFEIQIFFRNLMMYIFKKCLADQSKNILLNNVHVRISKKLVLWEERKVIR